MDCGFASIETTSNRSIISQVSKAMLALSETDESL
jgi:hypothetical protein